MAIVASVTVDSKSMAISLHLDRTFFCWLFHSHLSQACSQLHVWVMMLDEVEAKVIHQCLTLTNTPIRWPAHLYTPDIHTLFWPSLLLFCNKKCIVCAVSVDKGQIFICSSIQFSIPAFVLLRVYIITKPLCLHNICDAEYSLLNIAFLLCEWHSCTCTVIDPLSAHSSICAYPFLIMRNQFFMERLNKDINPEH